MMPGWLLALFILGALVGGRVWYEALKKLPPVLETDAMGCRYRMPDMVFAGFLGLFFLLMITGASDETPPVTQQVLLNGIAFYLSLVTAIFSFLLLRGLSPGEIFGLGRGRIPLRTGEAPPDPLVKWFAAAPLDAATDDGQGECVVVKDVPENAQATWVADARRGAMLFLTAYPSIMLVQMGAYALLQDQAQAQDIVRFLVEQTAWGDRLAVLALALVVAPLAEEVVFRGYLYGVVRQLGGRWCAIATTSLLFSAIHLHLPSLPALFLLGVVLSLIYEVTRRLWIPFFLHALFNGISAGLALLWPELVR